MELSQNTEPKGWLTPQEVSEEYGFSIITLARWRMSKTGIPYSKVGRLVKYKRVDVEAFLEAHTVKLG